MLNIVVPMAGHGSRFAKLGYSLPKPLIEVHGLPMIAWVIKNLTPRNSHRFIFICQNAHLREHALEPKLLRWSTPGSIVLGIDGVTEGAACTVLLAKQWINGPDSLMIANSDQWVDFSIDRYLNDLDRLKLDGLIMTMRATDPKWSFVRLDADGWVDLVAEKKVISNEATVGVYNFKSGSKFVAGAESMIRENLRVNGEFYVAPVYNTLIANGAKIGIHNVGEEFAGMYGLGTPEDLVRFLGDPRSIGFRRHVS